ncbi:hypothetical protein AZI86_07005 [Bdellovibrio bacteriovorus]|uniref:Uncharacterized protein n=1 Tax=Bdellovibrio bacteriovorus TaxID=959 RepID=A0A150WQK7_BDEBC|nr:hypothetical protein [Bdellovibrio bacteriovorus]KYG66783.1 hypothetical protein AZI86_07005 [Bdellovibrio bacteriovorus]
MKAIICVLATLITSTALAYKDGTYNCKVGDSGLPDRVIKIETITLGSAKVPYMTVSRSYQQGGKIIQTEAKGFATSHITENREILMLAQLRFDFINDEIQNCRQK